MKNSAMAGKKVIITESQMKQLVAEEFISKTDLSSIYNSREFKDAVNKAVKDNRDSDKDFEKNVRKIIADSINSLFRGMWERSGFWTNLINK